MKRYGTRDIMNREIRTGKERERFYEEYQQGKMKERKMEEKTLRWEDETEKHRPILLYMYHHTGELTGLSRG